MAAAAGRQNLRDRRSAGRKAGGFGSGRNRYCRIPVLAFRAEQASQLNRILVRCARSRRRSRRRVRSTDRYASVPHCRAAYVAPSVTEVLQALWRNRNKNTGRLIVLHRTCRPFALTGARPSLSEEGRRLVLPAQHQRSRRIQERLSKSFSPNLTPGLEPDRDEGKRLWRLGAIKWPSSQAARGLSAERRPDSWHNAARDRRWPGRAADGPLPRQEPVGTLRDFLDGIEGRPGVVTRRRETSPA